jgi:hypothetical protein
VRRLVVVCDLLPYELQQAVRLEVVKSCAWALAASAAILFAEAAWAHDPRCDVFSLLEQVSTGSGLGRGECASLRFGCGFAYWFLGG